MTLQAVNAVTSVGLDRDGLPVGERVPVSSWTVAGGVASVSVVFGPFSERVRATGVRVHVDDAVTVERFDSELSLPAGMTFRADVSIGVG